MSERINIVTLQPNSKGLNELSAGDFQTKWGMGNHGMLVCPRCLMALQLIEHTFKIEDGLVTIEPSVGHLTCGLHIFVKKGKIEWLADVAKVKQESHMKKHRKNDARRVLMDD